MAALLVTKLGMKRIPAGSSRGGQFAPDMSKARPRIIASPEAPTGIPTQYRVLDAHDRHVGWYTNPTTAHHEAMKLGGRVREYDKKPQESLPAWLVSDRRPYAPADGGSYDTPERTSFDRPAVKFRARGADGKDLGWFEDRGDADMAKYNAGGGTVERHELKPAYNYANPRSHMKWWQRLIDNGQAYKKTRR